MRYDFEHLTNNTIKEELVLSSEVLFSIRTYFYENSFHEIHTPLLSSPTKEYGGGEFIVLSKLQPGKFYSLPQSPQLYKQFLIATMHDVIGKYYQLIYNYRPEVGDETHIQQFRQIDFEIHNAEVIDIMRTIEDVINKSFAFIDIIPQFIELDYETCLKKYGTDSPDLRYEKAEFYYENDSVCMAIQKSDIVNQERFLSLFDDFPVLHCKENADYYVVNTTLDNLQILGQLRSKLISKRIVLITKIWSFIWVKELPLFKKKKSGAIRPYTHPHMSPINKNLSKFGLKEIKEKELLTLKGNACDLIVNGVEIAGGNVRNYDYRTQKEILELVGCSQYELESFYLPLLTLLKTFPDYRSGGAAIGFERLMMLLTAKDSLEKMQAFPMDCIGNEFFGGPRPLTSYEKLSIGIDAEPKLISESRKKVFSLLKKKENLIYTQEHVLQLEQTILDIIESEELLPNDTLVLRLACHWHDVEIEENIYDLEKVYYHKLLSGNSFAVWAKENKVSEDIIFKTRKLLEHHHGKDKIREQNDKLATIFSDAEYLCIFNSDHLKYLVKILKERENNSSFLSSKIMTFWKTLHEDFQDKFQTEYARTIFDIRFPFFDSYIQKEYEI